MESEGRGSPSQLSGQLEELGTFSKKKRKMCEFGKGGGGPESWF